MKPFREHIPCGSLSTLSFDPARTNCHQTRSRSRSRSGNRSAIRSRESEQHHHDSAPLCSRYSVVMAWESPQRSLSPDSPGTPKHHPLMSSWIAKIFAVKIANSSRSRQFLLNFPGLCQPFMSGSGSPALILPVVPVTIYRSRARCEALVVGDVTRCYEEVWAARGVGPWGRGNSAKIADCGMTVRNF